MYRSTNINDYNMYSGTSLSNQDTITGSDYGVLNSEVSSFLKYIHKCVICGR